MDKARVSFAILCYNQEAFIREAVEGAFSQDYASMEIVISDDCSSDRTFEIVKEMAAAYKGTRKVILNRNSRNVGIAGNLNQVLGLCSGELIVLAAGDDISLPRRVSLVVQAWNESGRKALMLTSRCVVIDEKGKVTQPGVDVTPVRGRIDVTYQQGTIAGFLRRRKPHVTGCATALSRALVSLFGPVGEKVTYEDTALCFRAVLAGGKFAWVDVPLVKYRRHKTNITFALHQARPQTPVAFEEVQRKRRCELDRFVESYKWFAVDARRAMEGGLLSAEQYVVVAKTIRRECRRMELKRELLDCGTLRRWAIFCELFGTSFRPRDMWDHIPYLLPRAVHRTGVISLNKVRVAHLG